VDTRRARSWGVIAVITALGIAVGPTGVGAGYRSKGPSTQVRISADRELTSKARGIDRAAVGVNRVASLLAADFGMTEEEIVMQRESLRVSWGDLTIAHTFADSDKGGMTVAQILELHDRGMGWGQIAAGLGFRLSDAVRAVNSESRVARGRAKADGQTARIGGDGVEED
jgi:hypothetical protein